MCEAVKRPRGLMLQEHHGGVGIFPTPNHKRAFTKTTLLKLCTISKVHLVKPGASKIIVEKNNHLKRNDVSDPFEESVCPSVCVSGVT